MATNELIFSRSGSAGRLYRVNPLLFGQKKLNNKYFLPDGRDLPTDIELRFWTFDFGFSDPSAVIGPYDTAYFGIPAGRNFLACSITGASAPQASATPPAIVGKNILTVSGAPGAQVTPSYLMNFLHTHEGVQRQWANKNEFDLEGVGGGVLPTIFKSPILILQGDTLTCQVQNLANSNLQVQIVLAGGEF
jgi:hypothetical protein